MTATPVLEIDTSLETPPVAQITVTAADAATVTVSRVVDGAEAGVLINGRNVGVNGSTYLEDYTIPFGVPVQYYAVAEDAAGVESAQSALTAPVKARVYGSGLWLSDPTIPGSGLEVRVVDWDEREFNSATSTALPLGGSIPIGLLATRQGASFTLITRSDRPEFRTELRHLIATSPLMLLRPSPILDEPARYCTVGSVRERRLTIGHYRYELGLTEVRTPAVAVKYGAPGKRYEDLVYYYDSYDDPKLTQRTYIELARDPRP